MITHEPENYVCPFCNFLAGTETDYNQKQDIVYQNEFTTAFVSPKSWVNNVGHVLVVPNKHFESLYNIPNSLLAEVYKTVKKVAIAVRGSYECNGVSTRQHNEPAGDQDVWHFHVHVFPRYNNDQLYKNHDQYGFVDAKTRLPYAEKLRNYFASNRGLWS